MDGPGGEMTETADVDTRLNLSMHSYGSSLVFICSAHVHKCFPVDTGNLQLDPDGLCVQRYGVGSNGVVPLLGTMATDGSDVILGQSSRLLFYSLHVETDAVTGRQVVFCVDGGPVVPLSYLAHPAESTAFFEALDTAGYNRDQLQTWSGYLFFDCTVKNRRT